MFREYNGLEVKLIFPGPVFELGNQAVCQKGEQLCLVITLN